MILKYLVKIIGHVEPFKWEVDNPTHTGMGTGKVSGTADSYEDALFQASEAAHQMEHDRKHKTTVRTETIFEVDTDEDPEKGVSPLSAG